MKAVLRAFAIMLFMSTIVWMSSAQQDPALPGFIIAQDATVEVLNTYPHDTSAFTQGLLWFEGSLYESTGNPGQAYPGESTLREVDLTTGEPIRSIPVQRPLEQATQDNPPPEYFAEGLTRIDDRLLQLTWRAGEAFIYDLDTFERLETITYAGQGWGICNDGRYLYMSDATQYLAVREIDTFDLVARILVTVNGSSVRQNQLNELECVGDSIYANVWQTNFILEIDKFTGNVIRIINAEGLLTDEDWLLVEGTIQQDDGTVIPSRSGVLNGIAYNLDTETFYITGKDWPKLFEVRFNTEVASTE